ncbi:disintegrin and metalloproteinase domain-containing protein 9-like [Pseudophryne corroboree]|uniref:disintegrin and metalloproteinase domain-containing protein 9-like n=1 Tax=Pseudophryne corroboree TaxID=495146 RepID=UPI0030816AA4
MWARRPQLALLYLLVWGYQVYGLPDHEIVFPKRVVSRVRRNTGRDNTEQLDENISYNIPTVNGTLILNLQRNRGFVSKDFQHFTYSEDGGLQALNRTVPQYNCYYHGQVEGMEDSVVAISTCNGLRGVMHLTEVHYGIEPVEKSLHGEHRLYHLEKDSEPSTCGVGDFMETPHTTFPSHYHLHRMKRAVLPTTNYVELCIVVDNLRYQIDNSNITAVEDETIQLANIVDGMYEPLNIRIVLINLITWTTGNPFDVTTGSAGDVLGRFSQWKGATPNLRRCDIYHLLIGHGAFSGGVVGMAFVSTVCSPSYATAISTFSAGSTPSTQATIVAHELGHVLGMSHDDGRCPNTYIMNSVDGGAKSFSSCSLSDFEALIVKGGGSCLLNPPDPSEVLSVPLCGNNIVETGEECDCGTPQQCTNPCCIAATCRLTSGSQCAQGLCCDKCQFKVASTVCRPAADSCDFPEYCNGSHALCPVDVYLMNGYPCNNLQSYCYGGVCQTYDAQCQTLFGPGTRKGNDTCFQVVNLQGDRYGNCGMVSGSYTKCTLNNALCGKIQCMGNFNSTLAQSIIIRNLGGLQCLGADFNLGSDVPDPALVHQGTACGEGMACVNYACVNATNLGFNCDIKGKCNNNGVCNNNGNCNCNDGWAPPYCDRSGYGGSIDSGPPHSPPGNALRNGLLIFFLLVVPILILIVVMWIKSDAIRRRFCRKKRHRGGDNQRPAQTNNGNHNAASNIPRNQDSNFSDVFTISHHFPRRPPVPASRPPVAATRPPMPGTRPPVPGTGPQPPLRPPYPPRQPTAPQYNW